MVAACHFGQSATKSPSYGKGCIAARLKGPVRKSLRFSCLVSLIVLEAARRGARLPRVDDDDVERLGHGPFAYAVAEGLEARLATLPASVRS